MNEERKSDLRLPRQTAFHTGNVRRLVCATNKSTLRSCLPFFKGIAAARASWYSQESASRFFQFFAVLFCFSLGARRLQSLGRVGGGPTCWSAFCSFCWFSLACAIKVVPLSALLPQTANILSAPLSKYGLHVISGQRLPLVQRLSSRVRVSHALGRGSKSLKFLPLIPGKPRAVNPVWQGRPRKVAEMRMFEISGRTVCRRLQKDCIQEVLFYKCLMPVTSFPHGPWGINDKNIHDCFENS